MMLVSNRECYERVRGAGRVDLRTSEAVTAHR